jgi:hypothetical protein
MITFSELGRKGRLGNAMFQYAAMKALACKLNCKAKIPPDLYERFWHGQKCLLNCFKLNCEVYTVEELHNTVEYNQFNEIDGYNYNDNFWNCRDNTNLNGHFESELYFHNIKDIIKAEFTLKDEYMKIPVDYMKNLKSTYLGYQIIGLHIRKGDHPHFDETKNAIFIEKALKQFEDITNKKFIIFTGGSTDINNDNLEDIMWCKNNINHDQFIFSENTNTINDFALMTLCDHLILNSTSTLGWWAAYLNNNKQKRIVVNSNTTCGKNIKTFWLDSHIKII